MNLYYKWAFCVPPFPAADTAEQGERKKEK